MTSKPESDERTSKEEKYNAVSVALMSLLNSVGPNKITHSQVAKKANVSRAWIYKYVGSERDDLIRFAIEHVGKQVTERDLNEAIHSKEELIASIVRGVERMFENTAQLPWLIPVYFKYRGTETAPGKIIDAVEQAYVKRQAQNFVKHFSSFDSARASLAAEVLTSLRMGLAFSWQRGDLKKKADQEVVLASVHHWLNELLMA